MSKRSLRAVAAGLTVAVVSSLALSSTAHAAEQAPINEYDAARCIGGSEGVVYTTTIRFVKCSYNPVHYPSLTPGRYAVNGTGAGHTTDGYLRTLAVNPSNPTGNWIEPCSAQTVANTAGYITIGPYSDDPFFGDVPEGFVFAVSTGNCALKSALYEVPKLGSAWTSTNAGGAQAIYLPSQGIIHSGQSSNKGDPTSTDRISYVGWYGMVAFGDIPYLPLPNYYSGVPDPEGPASACGSVIVATHDRLGEISPAGFTSYDVDPPMAANDLLLMIQIPDGWTVADFEFSIRWGGDRPWRPITLVGPPDPTLGYVVPIGDTVPGPRVLSELRLQCVGPDGTGYGGGSGSPIDDTEGRETCSAWKMFVPEGVEVYRAGTTYTFRMRILNGTEIVGEMTDLRIRGVDDLGWIYANLSEDDHDLEELDGLDLLGSPVALPFTPNVGTLYTFDWTPDADTPRAEAGLVCWDDQGTASRGIVYPFDASYADNLDFLEPGGQPADCIGKSSEGVSANPVSWVKAVGKLGLCFAETLFVPDTVEVQAAYAEISEDLETQFPFSTVFVLIDFVGDLGDEIQESGALDGCAELYTDWSFGEWSVAAEDVCIGDGITVSTPQRQKQATLFLAPMFFGMLTTTWRIVFGGKAKKDDEE